MLKIIDSKARNLGQKSIFLLRDNFFERQIKKRNPDYQIKQHWASAV